MIPWRFHPDPAPGELLSSFLLRAARLHGAIPHTFCSIHFPGHAVWNRDIDRNPDMAFLREVSEISGQDLDLVEAMTFKKLCRLFGGTAGVVPWVLPVGIWHRKRKNHGLQFCPLCLREGTGFYRRSWRLAFMTLCPNHGIPLSDACDFCGEPLAPHRSPCGLMFHCHACGQSLSSVTDSKLTPCIGNRLEDLLLSAFDGETVLFMGEKISADDWLTGCRHLMSLAASRILHVKSGQSFECSRTGDRMKALAALGCWLQHWPDGFLEKSEMKGVTQRSFLRCGVLPSWLASQVVKLPPGFCRQRRPRGPLLGLTAIRRSGGNWRQKRAVTILNHLRVA